MNIFEYIIIVIITVFTLNFNDLYKSSIRNKQIKNDYKIDDTPMSQDEILEYLNNIKDETIKDTHEI